MICASDMGYRPGEDATCMVDYLGSLAVCLPFSSLLLVNRGVFPRRGDEAGLQIRGLGFPAGKCGDYSPSTVRIRSRP